jgi:alkylated DNA repair dioxygenase AlkB
MGYPSGDVGMSMSERTIDRSDTPRLSQGGAPERLPMPDAEVLFYPAFFAPVRSDELFRDLLAGLNWKQEQIKFYGRAVNVPRLTAWHGDEGKTYRYSGIRLEPEPWTPALREIRQAIEAVSGVAFNSVLANLYRGPRDSVAWHSDDEPELGRDPVIGSVSLGETRSFRFRHRRDRTLKYRIDLTHGSYLLMRGPTQHCWQHEVPKASGPCGPRINLTFRVIH